MDYQGKNVVVTGGTGFIGINLVRELCRQEACVTVLDLPSADFSSLPTSVKIIKGDILDKMVLGDVLRDSNYVFHLAAKTDLDGNTIDSYQVNFDGTLNVVNALRSNKNLIKFVFFSTQLVVGLFNETRFINVREPYRTKTFYGQSKILAEKIVLDNCPKYGIPFIILRPTSVYGPHGKIPYRDLFLTIKRHQYFHIGKANNLISMAYVKNIVEQCLYLARNETRDKIFFGNDLYPYTMREFSDAVADYFGFKIPTIPDPIAFIGAYMLGVLKLVGIKVPLYPFRLRNIKANYCYDIGDLLELGYYPTYRLKEGVKESLDWYVNNDPEFQS